MKIYTFYFLFICLIISCIFSCKKDDIPEPIKKIKKIDSTLILIKSIRKDVHETEKKLLLSSKKEANNLYDELKKTIEPQTLKIYSWENWINNFDYSKKAKHSKPIKNRLKLLSKGYIEPFEIGNNLTDIRIKPNLYEKMFSHYVTNDYKKFIKLETEQANNPAEKDAKLVISLKQLSKYLTDWENFINDHKHSDLYAIARDNYFYYLSLYLYGSDNTPSFKEKREKDFYTRRAEYFYQKNSEEFSKFIKKYPHTHTTAIIRGFLSESKNNTLENVYQSVQRKAEYLYPSTIFPTSGNSLKSFEKGSYKIQMTALGDLNGDNLQDAVIVLKNKVDSSDFRATLVLIKKANGSFTLNETGWMAIPEEYVKYTKRYLFEGISIDSTNRFNTIMRGKDGLIEAQYLFSKNKLELDKIHFSNVKNEKINYNLKTGEVNYIKPLPEENVEGKEFETNYGNKNIIYKWPRKTTMNNSNPSSILTHIQSELLIK